jgi:hypothetical protein
MLYIHYLFYLIFSNLFLVVTSKLNFHYTDSVTTPEKENQLQHDCLRTPVDDIQEENNIHDVIYYCLSELSSKFAIETIDFQTNMTFEQLTKENITSQQLYL